MAEISAREATRDDLERLVELYALLAEEMTPLSPLWPLADGLPEPVADELGCMLSDPEWVVVVGAIDGVVFGLLAARVESILPQAGGRRVGSVRLVFVEQAAREVGIGEAMLAHALAGLRDRGIRTFDAHVLPGHRLVKNFFEASGFKARSIVMSHTDGD